MHAIKCKVCGEEHWGPCFVPKAEAKPSPKPKVKKRPKRKAKD